MKNEPRYITAQGKVRLEKDLLELETVTLVQLMDLVPDVSQGGHSAENGEMHSLLRDRELLEIRISALRESLENVTIIKPDKLTNTIHVGSTVLIQEGAEEPESYMIVGSAEANPDVGMISNISPLGNLLLGKHAGENICVKTGSDTTFFHTVEIQPAKGKAKHRYATI